MLLHGFGAFRSYLEHDLRTLGLRGRYKLGDERPSVGAVLGFKPAKARICPVIMHSSEFLTLYYIQL